MQTITMIIIFLFPACFSDTFSAIYIGPKTGEKHKVPLIVWPHGGPHSAFANNMSLESSLFGASGKLSK